jgi:hypothetical protein
MTKAGVYQEAKEVMKTLKKMVFVPFIIIIFFFFSTAGEIGTRSGK